MHIEHHGNCLNPGTKSRMPDELRIGALALSYLELVQTKIGTKETSAIIDALETHATGNGGHSVSCEYEGFPVMTFGMQNKRIEARFHPRGVILDESHLFLLCDRIPETLMQRFRLRSKEHNPQSDMRLREIIVTPLQGFDPIVTGTRVTDDSITFTFHRNSQAWIKAREELAQAETTG